MVSRYRGRVGEYLWEKDRERLERYKDRPWELQSRNRDGSAFFATAFWFIAIFIGLLVISLF